MPKVSVIIPTCNRSAYLKRAIESVCAQTYTDFEIIVIDDASTDDTPEVVAQFRDKPIKYIRHAENKGGSAARNTGITHSQSEYIAFLDDDDEWLPNKLDMQVALLDSSSDQVGVVYTGNQTIDWETQQVRATIRPTKRGDLSKDLMRYNPVGPTSSTLIRRKCFELVGMFDESLPSFQDYDVWIRISRKFHFENITLPLLKYYVHNKKIWSNPDVLYRGIQLMLEKHGTANNAFRKKFSYQLLNVGGMFCRNGNTKQGRLAYRHAIGLYPFEVRNYFYFLLSLCGEENFKKAQSFKEKYFAT